MSDEVRDCFDINGAVWRSNVRDFGSDVIVVDQGGSSTTEG